MLKVAIVNQSTRLADGDAELLTKACHYQLSKQAAPALYRRTWSVRFYAKGKTPPKSYYQLVLLDDSDQAGALGYHDLTPGGLPYGKIFVSPVLDNGGTALRGSLSVSAVVSHELLEMFVDRDANEWSYTNDGKHMVATEVCDPVEENAYDVSVTDAARNQHPVSVSDFVLHEWFNAEAPAGTKMDWMDAVSKPLQMATGGYIIQLDATTGQVNQIFASEQAKKAFEMKKPTKPNGRSGRRVKL